MASGLGQRRHQDWHSPTAIRLSTANPPRNPGGEAPRSDNKGNNCSFCPSNACRSLDFVSPADVHKKCISVWNSTFDLNKLSPGKRVVVTTLRAYSNEHPDATTLKNVDLKITRQ